MNSQDHSVSFTTVELAAIMACVLATLAEERPEGFEDHPLENSLVSVAEKIGLELGLSPVSITDPVHLA